MLELSGNSVWSFFVMHEMLDRFSLVNMHIDKIRSSIVKYLRKKHEVIDK